MAVHMKVRCVMVSADDNDEWTVELGPDEGIVSVEHEGQRAWVYIERIAGF